MIESLAWPARVFAMAVRILGPVVETLVRPMLDIRQHLTFGRSVGAQFIGDDAFGRQVLLSEQANEQSPGSLGVAARLNDLVEDVAVLIDGSPKPVFPAADRDDDFIQMPDIVARWFLAAQPASIVGAEFPAPSADRLVGEDDAPLEQQFFDKSQAQRKPEIQPDGMGDDLLRETVILVADGRPFHAAVITDQPVSSEQRDIAFETTPVSPAPLKRASVISSA